MADPVTNNLNNDDYEYEHSPFEILQSQNQYDFVRSCSATWDLVSMNISNDSDFRCLKAKINSFIKDHPTIVAELKNYFYDELIEHILKRSFGVQFTLVDSAHTNILYQRFFIEQDANIRIIFDYFFDDVRLLILTGKFEELPWSLRQAIIYTPKSILLKLTITWLNLKGAESLTTMLYTNLINPIEKQNENALQEQPSVVSFSFDQRNVWLFLTIYIFVLFAINNYIIGTMVNCLAGILLIAFILYYSLTHFNRFNR
jgi:hypothetical protein